MFKKIAIKTGVLTTVFILAVIVSSYVTNRGNTDMSADMGGATEMNFAGGQKIWMMQRPIWHLERESG